MTHSKIGFHLGPGGKKDGLGAWIQNSNQGGIPVGLKSADDYGPIFEAANIGLQYGVKNWLGFRFTVASGRVSREVPNYHLDPLIDARNLAQEVIDKLPPEFNKSVWVELINEPRDENQPGDVMWGNLNACEYLGLWCLSAATYFNDRGYKFTGPSFNSGRPGRDGFPLSDAVTQYNQMLPYLRYCSDNPEWAALSLHEYSWDRWESGELPIDWYPQLWGRFEAAIAAADLAGIPRTFHIFVTEFGFDYRKAPRMPEVEPYLNDYNALIVRFPQVEMVASWSLQSNYGDVDQDVNTWFQYDGVFNPGEQPAKTNELFGGTLPMDCKGLPREPYTRRYNVIPANATEQQAVAIFLEGWRRTRETTGGSYDDAGIGDLPTKVATLYGIPDDQKQVFINWYNQHYPGTLISFLPMPGEESPFEFAVYPVKGRTLQVNSYFNAPRSYGLHEGIDLFAQNGNEIVAVTSGIVDGIRAADPGTGYGVYVRVKHGERFFTWYTHLKSVSVFVGEVVAAGQVVGLADSTGNSTGDHLHLTLVDLIEGLDGYVVAKVVDPLPYLQKFSTSQSYQYNGLAVIFSPALHGPASDYEWQNQELRNMLNTLNMPVKFMSNGINADYYATYRKPALDLVRVFWQPHIYKTPQQAWNDDIRDGVLRFYNLGARDFEVLNEPNLPNEGAYLVWDENDFGDWLRELCLIIRSNCPGARLYFPGMSPGVPFSSQFTWTNKAWPKVKDLCYGFCLHSYSGITDNATNAINDIVNQVKESQSYLNLQVPLIVSESSVNRAATPTYKAQVYKGVENQLKSVTGVKGVVWYVSSWDSAPPDQEGHQEDWLKWGIWQPYSQQ